MSIIYFFKESVHGKTIIYRDNDRLISFGEWPDNIDYQQYLAWLAEGNTPEQWEPESN